MVVHTPYTTKYPDRWNKVEILFHQALEQDPRKRESFLRKACDEDQELINEVARLLSLHDPSDNFLEPPDESLQNAAKSNQQDHLIGKKFGSFRITSLISTGGMGTVWRSERADCEFDQLAAIKLMNIGIGSSDRLRRFEQERQTLAQLEHPYITRLIDGGTTDDGMPYLVMEYVEGRRIDQYCDEHRLFISERLKIFCEVCEAVQYAHQNLIVHRDLKPGNIFITHDGKPKLLDFGISKLLDDSSQLPQDQTQTAIRAMTPQYASPEQIMGESISTMSDVYSLGVVLYELLTGHSPYSLDTTSNFQQQRIICEHIPIQPSLVVIREPEDEPGDSTLDMVTPKNISSLRSEQSHLLQRRLRGDLDNIILKALQKEPDRRYNSVQQFSEDIQRYLTGRPVIARKDSFMYRTTKFVKRNKIYISLFMALIITLSGGIIGTLSGLKRARHERDVAVQVTTFLQDIFTSADPYQEGHDTMILELLKDASKRVEVEFLDQPEVAASVCHIIAHMYSELWLFAEAIPHAKKALELNRKIYGESHISTIDSMMQLGKALYFRSHPESVNLLRNTLSLATEHYSDDIPRIAEIKSLLGVALWLPTKPPKWEEAEQQLQESIEMYRPYAISHKMELTIALQRYAAMWAEQGIYDDHAASIFEETIELYRQQPGLRDRNRAEFVRMYSYFLQSEKRHEEEAEALEEFVALTPGMFQDHFNVQRSLWRLVVLHSIFLESDNTVSMIRQALRRENKDFALRNQENSAPWEEFALSFEEDLDIQQIMIKTQEMITTLTDHTCCVDVKFFHKVAIVARHGCIMGHLEEADQLMNDSIKIMQQRYPTQTYLTAFSIGIQGVCRIYQDQLNEAEPFLLKSYQIARDGYGMNHNITRLAIRRLIQLYERTKNHDRKKFYHELLHSLSPSTE